jgi:hypothetical protein
MRKPDFRGNEGQHMRLEHDQSTHPRLLRKPVLGEVSAKTRIATEKKPKNSKRSRFVDATHLDDDQKARFCGALEKHKIGDELGRQIFLGAVEYQISTFAHQLEHRVETKPESGGLSPAMGKTLQAIAEKARVLSGLLREMPTDAKATLTTSLTDQDGRGRGYDERYLCELGCEIDRLERACTAIGHDSVPEKTGPDPAQSSDFVAKLAEVFSECFEMQPSAEADGPFRAALRTLCDVTGLVIGTDPEFLARVLADKARG